MSETPVCYSCLEPIPVDAEHIRQSAEETERRDRPGMMWGRLYWTLREMERMYNEEKMRRVEAEVKLTRVECERDRLLRERGA